MTEPLKDLEVLAAAIGREISGALPPGEPVRITQEQTNACTCPLAMGVIGARYDVFVYPQEDCPIHGTGRKRDERD